MYRKLRKSWFLGTTIIIVVCLLVYAIIILSQMGHISKFKKQKDINNITTSEIRQNVKARGDVKAIIDFFGTDDTGTYYIIPISDEKYMGMYIYSGMYTNEDEILEDTYAYLEGEIDVLNKSITTRGIIQEMHVDCYKYFEEWFIETEYLGGNSPQLVKEHVVPYLYVVDSKDTGLENVFMVYIVGAIFCFGVIVVTLSIYFSGIQYRKIRKYIKKNNLDKSVIEEDFASGKIFSQVGTIRFGRRYLYYVQSLKNGMIEYNDILWAYKSVHTTNHSVNGVHTVVTVVYMLDINLKNGKKITIRCDAEEEADSIVKYLGDQYSHIYAGWHEELDNVYKNSREEMIRQSDERKSSI